MDITSRTPSDILIFKTNLCHALITNYNHNATSPFPVGIVKVRKYANTMCKDRLHGYNNIYVRPFCYSI